MAKLIPGLTVGKLTLLKEVGEFRMDCGRLYRKWECKCACGKKVFTSDGNLKSNATRSCGCLRGESNTTHGMSSARNRHPLYTIWVQMVARCTNPDHESFKNYGGRGIKVMWKSFEEFFEDMNPRPEGMWLERQDNDGPYSKQNCRWATPKEQQRNKRGLNIITVHGYTGCFSEACETFGVKRATAYLRVRKGWDLERVFPNC